MVLMIFAGISHWMEGLESRPEVGSNTSVQEQLLAQSRLRAAPYVYVETEEAQRYRDVFGVRYHMRVSSKDPTARNFEDECPNNPEGMSAMRLVSGVGFWIPNDHINLLGYQHPHLERMNGYPVGCKENPYIFEKFSLTPDSYSLLLEMFDVEEIKKQNISAGLWFEGLAYQYLHDEKGARRKERYIRYKNDALAHYNGAVETSLLDDFPGQPVNCADIDGGRVCFSQPHAGAALVGGAEYFEQMLECEHLDEGVCPSFGNPPVVPGVTRANVKLDYETFEGEPREMHLRLLPVFHEDARWHVMTFIELGNGMVLHNHGMHTSGPHISMPFSRVPEFFDRLQDRIYSYRAPELDGSAVYCYKGENNKLVSVSGSQEKHVKQELPYDLCENGGYYSHRTGEMRF